MKLLVAATLRSSPASSERQMSALRAAGESATLTIATEMAPAALAACCSATMSGLWPDCEMVRHSAPSAFSLPP